jgi:hypothetical protein
MTAPKIVTMYYVTAVTLGPGATTMPEHRTDMAKYFTRKDAEDHAELLSGPGFYDIQIDERPEEAARKG